MLLHANQVVPRGRLLADVWGERAPGSEHSLDVHISRLRKTLASVGEGDALIRRGRGYLLRVEEGALDLVRFEQRIAAGQQALAEGRPAAAASLLDEGLGLWRGEPLAEFADQAFAAVELGRLKERRLAALEARVDADLALGREAAIVGDLESLVDANPVPGAVSCSADAGALPGRPAGRGAGGLRGHAPPAHRRTWYRAR